MFSPQLSCPSLSPFLSGRLKNCAGMLSSTIFSGRTNFSVGPFSHPSHGVHVLSIQTSCLNTFLWPSAGTDHKASGVEVGPANPPFFVSAMLRQS